MKKSKKFIVHCDMGCVKIFTKDTAFFFRNGIGDGTYGVKVYKRGTLIEKGDNLDFINCFEVLTKNTVYLANYDCESEPIYTFDIGRWFVYRDDYGTIYIVYRDLILHLKQ